MVMDLIRGSPLSLSIAQEGDEAPREDIAVDYLPFGVKTLKLVVGGRYKGRLRLAPVRFSQVPGEKVAHEDGNSPPQFIVSWGGGQEDYYELDYPKKRIMHLLLRHVGDELNDPTLTLRAWPVTKDGRDGDELLRLPVKLTYPRIQEQAWPADTLVKPVWQEVVHGSQGESEIVLAGSYAPDYISRWWPRNRVIYNAYSKPPPEVRLRYRRLGDGDSGDLTVYAASAAGGTQTVLATIRGRIASPLYDTQQVAAELYRFGPHTWALRVWFFWLDKDISRQDLQRYGTRTGAEIEKDWQELHSTIEGGLAGPGESWSENHEIPDAERVDIVFNHDLQPLYAATDLHWREMWGRHEQSGVPIAVRIMNTRPAALAKDWQELGKVIDGWGKVILSQLLPNHGMKPPYNPQREVVEELAGAGTLGADPVAMQSHTPAIMNVVMQTRFTSTDVTEG